MSENVDTQSQQAVVGYLGALAYSRPDQALDAAQKIQSPSSQAAALSTIAQAQAIAGQFADALHTARHIQNETNRSSALTAIATGQAKAHHWKAARNTVAPCLGRDRLEAYTIILTEYAKANNPKLEQQLKRTKPTTDR